VDLYLYSFSVPSWLGLGLNMTISLIMMKQITLRPTFVNSKCKESRERNYGIWRILTISGRFRVLSGSSLAPEGD